MTGRISRRGFLRTAAAAGAGLSGGLLLEGCGSRKEFDVVINGAQVIDGSGARPFAADVAIKDARVAKIGKVQASRGAIVIEAKGLVVCPGFIDVHTHTDVQLLVNPKAESSIRQGVTTIVSGNCGSSPFPISGAELEETRSNLKEVYGLDLDWRDLAGFLARLERSGTALNYATLIGHGNVRAAVVGLSNRPAETEEVDRMSQFVAEALKAGARGLSSGLEYTPGSFAGKDELAALCRTVAGSRGVYATHMRDEGDRLLEALEEAIDTARQAGVSLQVSHLKTAYRRNWDKIGEALAKVEDARREGLDITCDRYPYSACSTGLSLYFPDWAREGTTDDFLARLRDRGLEPRLKEHVARQEALLGSWEEVLLCSVVTPANKWVEGLTVLDAASRAGSPVYEFMRDLLVAERGRVDMAAFIMSEDNLKRILGHPLVGIGSDGTALAPYGPLGAGKPHPRSYGTFPRVLGKYVREEKVESLEGMIKKMTSLPARKFGFRGRGLVSIGFWADLVLFDPDRVIDKATYADPHRYPEGIPYVLVNGRVVVDSGAHTGALAGQVLRKE